MKEGGRKGEAGTTEDKTTPLALLYLSVSSGTRGGVRGRERELERGER